MELRKRERQQRRERQLAAIQEVEALHSRSTTRAAHWRKMRELVGGQRTTMQHIPVKVRMEDGKQSVELVDVMRVWTEQLAMMGSAAPTDGDYDEQHRQEWRVR